MTLAKRNIPAVLCNLFILCAEIIIVIIKLPSSGASAFSYYTFLSNLMGTAAAVIFLISAFSGFKRLVRAKTIIRYYATCMLAFTFIIVITVLTPMAMSAGMDPSFLYIQDTAAFHHLIHPVLSFISFIFFEDNRTLKKKQPAVMLGISLAYTAVLITLNILNITDGPYPFFQVYNNPVWATLLWLAGLAGFDYLINYLIFRAGTRSSHRT